MLQNEILDFSLKINQNYIWSWSIIIIKKD